MAVRGARVDLSDAIARITSQLGSPTATSADFAAWESKEKVRAIEATRVTLSQTKGADDRHYLEYAVQKQLP